ncbi:MAG: hypothetical protein Q9204_007827, partial [Flavoplaca sp. TL-2023a]
GDPRHPHASSALPISILAKMGILHYYLPLSAHSSYKEVNDLASARAYANRDIITISPSAMGRAYDDNVQMFYKEHMHEDEEIRYIFEGAGFFDVRDEEDRWVRIQVGSGDLLILPAGIYHRFTVDEGDVSFGHFLCLLPNEDRIVHSSLFVGRVFINLRILGAPG